MPAEKYGKNLPTLSVVYFRIHTREQCVKYPFADQNITSADQHLIKQTGILLHAWQIDIHTNWLFQTTLENDIQ